MSFDEALAEISVAELLDCPDHEPFPRDCISRLEAVGLTLGMTGRVAPMVPFTPKEFAEAGMNPVATCPVLEWEATIMFPAPADRFPEPFSSILMRILARWQSDNLFSRRLTRALALHYLLGADSFWPTEHVAMCRTAFSGEDSEHFGEPD